MSLVDSSAVNCGAVRSERRKTWNEIFRWYDFARKDLQRVHGPLGKSRMLEIIALCSCACLACLWCVVALEVVKDRYRDGWVFDKLCGRRCSKCAWHKRIAKGSLPCRKSAHSRAQPPCDISPPYKLVCKMCRRVKAECICAKLFCHGMAMEHFIKCQPAELSFR